MFTRARNVTVTIAAISLGVLAAQPALAAPSDGQVAGAFSAMMTKEDAKALGIRGDVMRTFAVTTSDKGTPDAPWLCDLTGTAEVEGRGAKTLFSAELLSLGSGVLSDASQDVHSYGSAAKAKAAYRDILKKIGQCSGDHQPAPDTEGDGQEGITTTLTHSTRKSAQGDFVWVRSQTTMAGAENFASHQYLTVRLIGPYVQVLEVESEGKNAPDLSDKTIKAADALTFTLSNRWN